MKEQSMMLRSAVLGLMLACLQTIMAQTLTVTGEVTDEKTNEPLIGVNILEKGSQNGTVTDFDGKFKISVNKGSMLEFTYIGYLTKEVKATQEVIKLSLSEDTKSLEEVVVVGYGVQKKSDLTGSITSVKSEDIQNRAFTNVNEAFAGKASGVQTYTSSGKPGSTPSIQIRGIGSNGSSAPLFVVDGRVSGSAGNIDPNDIESIEILKDGASAAIYGASAGNGVILITTKKGKGTGSISYDLQLASQSLAKKPKVMNSEQFIDYFTEMGMLSLENIYNNWDFKQNTDWADVTFEPSLFMKHNLSFNGGNDNGNYYVSASYMDNNGMIKGKNDTQRTYSGMINGSYKIKPWLEVGTNNTIEYSKVISVSDGTQGDNILGSVIQCPPLTAPTYTLEDMPILMQNYMNLYKTNKNVGPLLQDENGNYYGISPYVSTNRTNPLILRDRAYNESRSLSLNGTAYANLTPVKNLSITSRLSYSFVNMEGYGNSLPYLSEYLAGCMQSYIEVSASSNHVNYWQWENFANYLHQFGRHNISAMIGTSFSETRVFGINGSEKGLNGDDTGFQRQNPLFLYFGYANPSVTKNIGGGEPSYTRKLAYFGRLNWDYAGRYLAQFSLRADATDTSVLPADNRWGYFPATSLGWVISNEKFMEKTQNWLSHLKLRASWGQNGSLASLGGYAYDVVISKNGQYNFGNTINYTYAYAPTSMGNPNLKWETSEQWNFGIDLRMLNNRLTFSGDYYRKNTKDLIVSGATLSTISGYPSSPINAGNIRNKGIELELGWQDHIGEFNYGIRANLTTLKNEVTNVEGREAIDGEIAGGYTITRFQKGHPAWYFYGYRYQGVNPENGEPIYEDMTGDGKITEKDKTDIGKGIPDITYGLTFTAAWKGLDLMVFGSGVAGVDIFNAYDATFQYAQNKLTHFTENRWSESNPTGTMPKANIDHYSFFASSASVFSGAYFKIKQIQLGYNLPISLLNKFHMSRVRVYGSLENFFTFSNYPGFDPEVTGMGVDFGMYPSSKKVVFGLNIMF